MIDFKLSRASGVLDIVIENGLLQTVEGDDELIQRLDFKVNFFENDWFIDLSFGIPYFGRILQRGANVDDLYGVYEKALAEEPGVERVRFMSLVIDPQVRILRLSATVLSSSGADVLVDSIGAT